MIELLFVLFSIFLSLPRKILAMISPGLGWLSFMCKLRSDSLKFRRRLIETIRNRTIRKSPWRVSHWLCQLFWRLVKGAIALLVGVRLFRDDDSLMSEIMSVSACRTWSVRYGRPHYLFCLDIYVAESSHIFCTQMHASPTMLGVFLSFHNNPIGLHDNWIPEKYLH